VSRPREQAKAAVLTAALRLVVREGCPAVTVKGIAEEAGVGRQTVYRWWSTKADVVVEAVADLAARASRPTPTDDTVADIRRNLRSNFAPRDAGPAISGLMADAVTRLLGPPSWRGCRASRARPTRHT
jgi:AcrR family transcriptional regulator